MPCSANSLVQENSRAALTQIDNLQPHCNTTQIMGLTHESATSFVPHEADRPYFHMPCQNSITHKRRKNTA
eukprot:4702730-Amphidinium_carterae.1